MIHYLKGDATSPIGNGNKIIAHICNDQGGWGAGGKWEKVEEIINKTLVANNIEVYVYDFE